MDNKKKLTDDELEKVAGGYDSDMFYEDHRKEVTDEPPKGDTREEDSMKLTGDLKNQVEKAESKEEKKKLIENAGMELTDDELDEVAGGFGRGLLPEDMFRQVG